MPKKYRSGFERLSNQITNTDSRYAAAIETVRENFSGFEVFDGYDIDHPDLLTESQKKQIRRYYNTLTAYVERGPVYKMSPKELPAEILRGGRKDVEAVMKAAMMPVGRKRAKFIFIEFDGETIPEVEIRNGSPVFVNRRFGYARETIEVNKVELAKDPIKTIMAMKPLVEGAKFFRILNGIHEFYGPRVDKSGRKGKSAAADLESLADEIKRLQEKYALNTKDRWDRWLFGIAAYYSDDKSINQILKHQSESREAYSKRIKKATQAVKDKRK